MSNENYINEKRFIKQSRDNFFINLKMNNLKLRSIDIQELNMNQMTHIDRGIIPLIIGSGLALMAMAYQFGKDAAERERG